LNEVLLKLFSRIQCARIFRDWMSLSTRFISALVSAGDDRGARWKYSTYSAVVGDRVNSWCDAAIHSQSTISLTACRHRRRPSPARRRLDQRPRSRSISSTKPPHSTTCALEQTVSHSCLERGLDDGGGGAGAPSCACVTVSRKRARRGHGVARGAL